MFGIAVSSANKPRCTGRDDPSSRENELSTPAFTGREVAEYFARIKAIEKDAIRKECLKALLRGDRELVDQFLAEYGDEKSGS